MVHLFCLFTSNKLSVCTTIVQPNSPPAQKQAYIYIAPFFTKALKRVKVDSRLCESCKWYISWSNNVLLLIAHLEPPPCPHVTPPWKCLKRWFLRSEPTTYWYAFSVSIIYSSSLTHNDRIRYRVQHIIWTNVRRNPSKDQVIHLSRSKNKRVRPRDTEN